MKKQTIIVTGANGLVGSSVIQQLVNQGYKVHGIVHHMPPAEHPLFYLDVELYVMDLLQETQQSLLEWLGHIRPCALVHCAAITNVDVCERQSDLTYAMNTRITRFLAQACARYGSHCLLVSTDYVFDGRQPVTSLYQEEDHLYPINHYGQSKMLAEIAVYEECFNWTRWTICRTSVVYGATPWTRPDFVVWLLRKLFQRESVQIAHDQISTPTYSVDLAMMIIQLIQLQAGGIYHTAGNTVLDRYHFAQLLAHYLDLDETLIQPVLTSDLAQVALRPLNSGLNVDKISQLIGTCPLSLEEGLALYLGCATPQFII